MISQTQWHSMRLVWITDITHRSAVVYVVRACLVLFIFTLGDSTLKGGYRAMWITGCLPTPVLLVPWEWKFPAHTLSCSSYFNTGQNSPKFLAHLTVHAVCWVTSVTSDSLWPYGRSPPGSSGHGIRQATVLEYVACPPPGDLPDLGIKPVKVS